MESLLKSNIWVLWENAILGEVSSHAADEQKSSHMMEALGLLA